MRVETVKSTLFSEVRIIVFTYCVMYFELEIITEKEMYSK